MLQLKMANYKRVFSDGYSYFITIVTHQRNPILIENIGLLREAFAVSKSKYSYKIEAIIILPDHIHMIITPKVAKEYPGIVKSMNYYFSKHCHPKYYSHIEQSKSRIKEGYKPIWQKRYYEHTIRDTKDFQEKIAYMYHNPIKHGLVKEAQDWNYSSFVGSVSAEHRST